MSPLTHKSPKTTWRDNYYLKTFLWALLLSAFVFVPFMLINGGRFLFYGDFNVQQIPFYRIAHDSIRQGNFGWNHLTDLGVNFIGSYSFYLLGSPFFWLTVPFPSEWLQYAMGPLFMLKFACAALAGYTYLHRYVKNPSYGLIGGLLYAFSGFSVYNIFFNHFHEAIIFFPFLLAALDEYMETRRRGVFALAVAACCFVNYYFFVGQVVFTLLYFFLRLACKSWRISVRDLLLLGLEAVLGVGISAALMFPSVFTVLQNSRVNSPINGWDALFYNKTQRYMHILQAFFFPPDLPARPNFTPDSGSKWASLGAWLPLFGMTGVIGWLQIRRKHWLKKFLFVLFMMALVPFLNASFQLFNSAYYGRWLYMLTLMMALATIMAFEYEPVNWKRAVTWTLVITVAAAGLIGLMPVRETADDGSETLSFGLMEYPTRFWTYVAISLLCIALTVFLLQFYKHRESVFVRYTVRVLSAVSVLYAVYFIAIGKTQTADPYTHLIPYALNGGRDVNIDDLRDDAVRTDFYESLDNSAMFWEVQSIQAFHSIVPGSIMEFYESIGVPRDVASRPDTTHYALRGITSVKWLFDESNDDKYFAGENNDEPQMPGWLYHGYANGFDVWENEYYVPMGFTYDYYIPRSAYDALSESQREQVMLKAVVLEDNQVGLYEDILRPLPDEKKVYTQAAYQEDCADRAAAACYSFRYTNTGFTAEIRPTRSNLVFFSVPYEDGWSAEVNGEKANIERVNVGFMAVKVPQGEKVVIEFTYRTPGLVAGIVVTVCSLMALIAYLIMMRREKEEPRTGVRPKMLERHPFAEYAQKKQVRFARKGAMVPKEYRIPDPPDGFAE